DTFESDYVGPIPEYIRAILNSGQCLEVWRPRLDMLLEIYAANNCLIRFARGLVDSIPALSETKLAPEGLSEWHAVWVEQAGSHPELELPTRLLRTAIDYFVSKEDESVLLDLPSEERRILAQVLGL